MASAEVNTEHRPAAANDSASDAAANDSANTKEACAPKGSKPPPSHPTYLQMITEAISSLKNRTGSSQYAIARYIDDKYKAVLPVNYKKLLTVQLRNLGKSGKVIKVKGSFKLPSDAKKSSKAAATKEKPAAVKSAKSKAAAKPNKAAKSGAAKVAANGAEAKANSAPAAKKVAKPGPATKKSPPSEGAATKKSRPAKKKRSAPRAPKSLKKPPKKTNN